MVTAGSECPFSTHTTKMHEIFAEGHLKSLLKSERGNLYEYNSSFTGSDQRDLEPCYLTTSHCRSKERITAAQL